VPTGQRGQVSSLAPWFGAKRSFAAEIVRQIGPHAAYFEPFCGSMAVLFAKPAARIEVVNDLHGDITNVAWVLQRRRTKARLLVALHDTICSEAHYRHCREQVLKPFDANPLAPNWRRAYYALCVWWMGRSGMAGTRASRTSFAARYTDRGGAAGGRFRNMVECLPAFGDRLARVDVLNRCGFEVLSKVEDRATNAIYCDPPYVVKAAEYAHDFAAADHARLAAAASRFENARVVVSYYPHPSLEDLYPRGRWTRVEVEVSKNIMNTRRETVGARATELMLINAPAAADDLFGEST
jgi:DNA adenine methylase